jgi:ABC-type Zn uptake system ZnuABC Zn-binding protein ZnuA
MTRIFGIVIVSLAILAAARAELKVASLSTITTDIARNVGDDKVKVISIIKPGLIRMSSSLHL